MFSFSMHKPDIAREKKKRKTQNVLQLSEEYIYALISFKCHLIHSSLNPSKVSLSQVKTINVARKEKPRQFRHEVRVWAIGQQFLSVRM